MYEKIVNELHYELNRIHSVSCSKKYWEILIGYWLGYFIQVCFDRYFMLKIAFEKYGKLDYITFDRDPFSCVANDTHDFIPRPLSDDYNEALYAQIIKLYYSKNVNIKTVDNISSFESSSNGSQIKYPNFINRFFNKIGDKFNNEFFIGTSLPRLVNIKLQLLAGEFPCVRKSRFVGKFSLSKKIRQNFYFFKLEKIENLEDLIRVLVSKNIPKIFLEGFHETKKCVKDKGWSTSPKNIYTSTSHYDDEFFKFWMASKIEKGTKINVFQHGGNYGTGKFSFFDYYDISISDTFYSWGYKVNNNQNVVPLGNIKTINTFIKYKLNGTGLLVMMDLSRYSYMLYSVPISACQINRYIEEQILFLDNLIPSIRKKINIRLHRLDFSNFHQEKLLSKHNDLTFDKNLDIINSIKKCRIYISTYNATTYLESLYWNIPTICYWDPKYWEINDESKALFEVLISVGILYHDPVKAAHKINQVWDNVDAWWQSDELQNARKLFCNKYSKKIKSIIELKNNLNL